MKLTHISSASRRRLPNLTLLPCLIVIFISLISFANGQGSGGSDDPKKRESGNTADKNLRSMARVNPSTLAMEMNIPLMSYPGRNGNSLPVDFRYSSKLWQMQDELTWWYWAGMGQKKYVTDTHALYGQRSAAGWTSGLVPPRIDDRNAWYNVYGKPYGDSVGESAFDDFYSGVLQLIPEHDLELSIFSPAACGGACLAWELIQTADGERFNCLSHALNQCVGTYDDEDPTGGPLGSNELYYVKRLRVIMPDGSSHEFRQSDQRTLCGTFQQPCTPDLNGIYLSVDGSGLTLVKNANGHTLYLANGGIYLFPAEAPGRDGIYATSFTDVYGNKMTFTEDPERYGLELDQVWTDTMGRPIVDPIPHNLDEQTQSAGTQYVDLPGLGETVQHYEMTWAHLKPVGCEESTDENCVGHGQTTGGGLDDQTQKLYHSTLFSCDGNLKYNLWENSAHPEHAHEVLFTGAQTGMRPCNPIDILRDENGEPVLDENHNPAMVPARFNPIVLTEVKLPNNQTYKFGYNRYGEISRVTYPTGSYETFDYSHIAPIPDGDPSFAHDQMNRGVTEHRVYSADGVLEQRWTYLAEPLYQPTRYKVTTTAPLGDNALGEGIRTERFLHVGDDHSPFGFTDPKVGMPYDERTYDENGVLRSRVLTEYVTKDSTLSYPVNTVRRDLRVKRTASFAFEPGSSDALATFSETVYDESGSSDPAYFSHLNVKSAKGYHYAALPASEVDYETLAWTTIEGWFPASKLASVSETDYSYNADYKSRGILGRPIESRVLDPANTTNVLAKTQTLYDEGGDYAIIDEGTTTGYAAPTGTYAHLRGNATTTKTWVKETDTWLSAHAQYDNFGNLRKAWDVSGDATKFVETIYEYETENPYFFAYPVKVIMPAPDPTNTTGTSQKSEVSTTYDFNTGLSLSVTDDFGQVSTTEYADALLRPTKVNPVVIGPDPTGPVAKTFYDDDERTVRVEKQLDAVNWDVATSYMDSLGRAIKTVAEDSQGDVIVETHYDKLGRVDRVTNPYRSGDTVYWSKTRYDAMGRAVESYAPEPLANLANAASLGVTTFAFSTVTGYVGAVVTATDASGRKGRSITNALGQLLRVDEPTAIGGTAVADLGALDQPAQPTLYTYDAFGKMVKVAQGGQNRFFKYDALGRLLRVNQPEQEYNSNLNLSDTYNSSGHWTAAFAYDVLGNVVRATDANGVNIVNEYDRAGRVTKGCYSKPNINSTATTCSALAGDLSTDTPEVTFWYDGKGLAQQQSPTNWGKGKLTKVDNGISTTEYMTFDNFGRLTRSRQITDGVVYGTDLLPMTYTYNLSGALIEERYPSGRVVKNEFESDGDLRRISGVASANALEKTYANSFSYTPDGRIEKLKLGNGLWEAAKFNTRGQVTELALGRGVASADLWKLGYEYGELNTDGTVDTTKNTGNIAKQSLSFSGLTHPYTQAFKYDPLYRIKEAQETVNENETWKQTYGYDRFGNRTAFYQKVGALELTIDNLTLPEIDPATNRFKGSQGYTYDKNGNLIADPASGGRTFVFNGENKQTQVKDANGQQIGTYFYDGEGKRVKKVTDLETTVFVYSGGKLVAEYSTAAPPSSPTTSYTMTDMLGSPRVLTNSLGEVVSRRDFMPFGEELFADGQNRTTGNDYSLTGQDGVRKRFTGYEKDIETGLDFAEARYYNNQHARFTAVDPLLASGKSASPQTFNRYVYVMNSPLTLTDPTGLQSATDPDDVYDPPSHTRACEQYGFVCRAMEWIKRKISWGGETATTWESVPRFMAIEDPESFEYLRRKRGNVVLRGTSPNLGEAADGYYPYGTPEQMRRIENVISTVDQTGVYDMWLTAYKHSGGQASDGDLALSVLGYGTNFIPAGKYARKADDVLQLTTKADDAGTLLYRGIPKTDEKRFAKALEGKAVPTGGHRNPDLHNEWDTHSDFTSWTTKRSVAVGHACFGGVVLTCTIPNTRLVWSPDQYKEFEVLVTGIVEGATSEIVRRKRP